MIPYAGRPIETGFGRVAVPELLSWDRSSLPGAAMAREICDVVVKRRRASFDVLWTHPVGVRLVDDWRRALNDTERLRLAPFVNDGGPLAVLEQATLREVKEAMKLPVAEVLLMLARLEALYWVATPAAILKRPRKNLAVSPQDAPAVELTPSFVEEVRACLKAAWVQGLSPDDLRFPYMDGYAIGPWLEPQLNGMELSGAAHTLCLRLLRADRATWSEELADIAEHAIGVAARSPGSPAARPRWLEIFKRRHGGIAGETLKDIGDSMCITRERVRQIGDYMLQGLACQALATPALAKVLAECRRHVPMPVNEANVLLAPLLGAGHGIRAAIEFAEVLRQDCLLQRVETPARTLSGYVQIDMIEATESSSPWLRAVLAKARAECAFIGCTNLQRMAGYLAFEHGIARDRDSLRALFATAPGFRMLEEEGGWFTLADSDASRGLASRVRKILAVATGPVGIDTVAAALFYDDRWLYRDKDGSRGMAFPPQHVLTELFRGWEWLSSNAHNNYCAVVDPDEALNRTERAIVRVIQELQGAATHAEVVKAVTEELNVSSILVTTTLAGSTALCRLEKSIYGLRSEVIPVEGLVEARKRRQLEIGRHDANHVVDLTRPIRVKFTQSGSDAPVAHRVVYLPSHLKGVVDGSFDHAGGLLPSIRLGSGWQFRTLAKIAHERGIQSGARFELEFCLKRRTYDFVDVAANDAPAPPASEEACA